VRVELERTPKGSQRPSPRSTPARAAPSPAASCRPRQVRTTCGPA